MSLNLELGTNTKDLVLTSGKNLSILSSPNLTAQRIESRLSVFKGEWFLDYTLGIPFFTQILTKTRDKNKIDTIFRNEVLTIPEVLRIEQFESELTKDREYNIITLSVKVESGDIVVVQGA